MPTLNITTNVPVDGVMTSDLLRDASKAVAKTLGKPESYVLVSVRGSIPMCFGGTEEPVAFAEVISLGALGPEPNKKLSAALADILESKLGVPRKRFYINFCDKQRSDFGWNGGTF
eukprot:TRINITY_DN35628_c0_g1_i1.p1 TRINITY_DN35628_c0_g1~~TRINITY_DN35628_c0_g1_i1.p1  ORF type:complete len:116 (+),score=16.18 TRINITY_DN35628_c0_g1_i1:179-526(+)